MSLGSNHYNKKTGRCDALYCGVNVPVILYLQQLSATLTINIDRLDTPPEPSTHPNTPPTRDQKLGTLSRSPLLSPREMYFGHKEAQVVRDLNHTQGSHREGPTRPHLCNECRAFSCEQLRYDALDAGPGRFHDPSKGKFLRRVSSAVLDLWASQCEVYRLFRWQLLRHSDAVKLVLDWIELEDPKHVWEDGNPSLTIQCLARYQEKEEPEKYNLRFNISDSSGKTSNIHHHESSC